MLQALLLMHFTMLPEVGEGAVGLSAGVAVVGAFSRVDALVFGQPHSNRKGLPALLTFKGLLPSVQAPMILEVGGLPEGLPAIRARVGTLTGMDAAVDLEGRLCAEQFLAVATLKGFRAGRAAGTRWGRLQHRWLHLDPFGDLDVPVQPFVGSQLHRRANLLAAHGALKVATHLATLVFLQLLGSDEGSPAARGAAMRLLASVTQLVNLQQTAKQERAATGLALVRILPGVVIAVHEQAVRPVEDAAAFLAFVRIVATVNQEVLLQRGRLREALLADVTAVGTLARVCQTVALQIGRGIEAFATLLAVVRPFPCMRQ